LSAGTVLQAVQSVLGLKNQTLQPGNRSISDHLSQYIGSLSADRRILNESNIAPRSSQQEHAKKNANRDRY
jgi:hypothetical protein